MGDNNELQFIHLTETLELFLGTGLGIILENSETETIHIDLVEISLKFSSSLIKRNGLFQENGKHWSVRWHIANVTCRCGSVFMRRIRWPSPKQKSKWKYCRFHSQMWRRRPFIHVIVVGATIGVVIEIAWGNATQRKTEYQFSICLPNSNVPKSRESERENPNALTQPAEVENVIAAESVRSSLFVRPFVAPLEYNRLSLSDFISWRV